MKSSILLAILPLGLLCPIWAQQRVAPVDTRVSNEATRQVPNATPPSVVAPDTSDYILGPGDQISIIVPDLADQFTTDGSETFRVDMGGDISIPLVGRIQAAGLTSRDLELAIAASLGKILKQPEVTVNITEFHSQPVSVIGEVNSPGLHQLVGNRNLFEALSLAGGFTENLGNTITITRKLKWGPIPLPNAHDDATRQFSVASLKVKGLLNASDPAENIALMPDDAIAVSRSEVVYAVGSVNKPGGFDLGQEDSLSALQVISLAQGLDKSAAPQRAMILRAEPGSKTRIQIPVNVKELMQGRGSDLTLQAEDILFIPNSKAKSISYRTLDAIVTAATGVAIYGSKY